MNKILFTSSDLQTKPHLPPQEWYLAGGLGNFCAYSLIDRPLRAYHNLFQVALDPPAQRWILLSGLVVYVNSKLLHPSPFEEGNNYSGLQHWLSFEWHMDRVVYHYAVDGSILKKTIFISPEKFKTTISFELISGNPVDIEIHPCLNSRNVDSFQQELDRIGCSIKGDRRLDVDVTGRISWHLHFSQGAWHEESSSPVIWYPFEHYSDGYCQEKVYIPGLIRTVLYEKDPLTLVCSLNKRLIAADKSEGLLTEEKEISWRQAEKFSIPQLPYLIHNLKSFLVTRKDLNTSSILAGYPWFMDWGRDTMITLRGMLYVLEPAKIQKILDTFWKYLSRGMIPNCFDSQEAGKAYYNTIDATLWLFVVMYEYYLVTSDKKYVEKCLPYFEEIISSHIQGTRWNIKVDEDGLLAGGDRNTQLTWTDVKIGWRSVTPRMGKAVEVNALWYNALQIYRFFSRICRKEFKYERYIDLFKENFLSVFFIPDSYHLADWVYDGETNCQNRPNQVFCLALPFRDYLNVTVQQRIFETVTMELFTPFGLRTLSPHDLQYRGYYGGDRYERDSAYHQGTVWPWLMGPYIDAYANTTMDCQSTRKKVIQQYLSPLLNEINHGNVGSIPEVFSGDWPYESGGCFAQAWSVSEVVRVIFRYLSAEH